MTVWLHFLLGNLYSLHPVFRPPQFEPGGAPALPPGGEKLRAAGAPRSSRIILDLTSQIALYHGQIIIIDTIEVVIS